MIGREIVWELGTKDQNTCTNVRGGLPTNPWSVDTWSNPCASPYLSFHFSGMEP